MPELKKYYSAMLPPEEVLRDIAECFPQTAGAIDAIFTKLELLQEANDEYAREEEIAESCRQVQLGKGHAQ